jgi:hypothetical protein
VPTYGKNTICLPT